MTWAEFKRQVESQDVQDQDEIEWIDASNMADKVEITGEPRSGEGNRSVAMSTPPW